MTTTPTYTFTKQQLEHHNDLLIEQYTDNLKNLEHHYFDMMAIALSFDNEEQLERFIKELRMSFTIQQGIMMEAIKEDEQQEPQIKIDVANLF